MFVFVFRQVSVEQLSREVERLAAVLQSRQAELRSITQQVYTSTGVVA